MTATEKTRAQIRLIASDLIAKDFGGKGVRVKRDFRIVGMSLRAGRGIVGGKFGIFWGSRRGLGDG